MNDADLGELRRRERDEERRDRDEIAAAVENDAVWDAARFAVAVGLSDEVPRLVYARWQAGLLAGRELEAAIWASWVHNRAPLRSIGERRWLRLFKAAGFMWVSATAAVAGEEVAPAYEHVTDQPVEPLDVWRGAAVASNGRGMSWSLHRGVAEDFADSVAANGSEAAVWKATLPPRAVLAMFGDERETEVVVNPNMLRGRVTFAAAAPARALRPWKFGT